MEPGIPKLSSQNQEFTCEFCRHKSLSSRKHVAHMIMSHPMSRPYPCNQCDYRARTSAKLDRHFKVHNNKNTKRPAFLPKFEPGQPYVCLVPNIQHLESDPLQLNDPLAQYPPFKSNELQLALPTQINYPQLVFTCSLCDFVSNSFADLDGHSKAHEKLYMCTLGGCHHIAISPEDWSRHLWSHRDDMTHRAVCCKCRGKSKMSNKCRQRPFKCPSCKTRYTFFSNFQTHCKAFHGLETCDQAFNFSFLNDKTTNLDTVPEGQTADFEFKFVPGNEEEGIIEEVEVMEEEEQDNGEDEEGTETEEDDGTGEQQSWSRVSMGSKGFRWVKKKEARRCQCIFCRFVEFRPKLNLNSCQLL